MNWLSWLVPVYFSPNEDGGGESEATEADAAGKLAEGEGEEKPKKKGKSQLSDAEFQTKFTNFLRQRGLDPNSATVEDMLKATMQSRDEEIVGRIEERKKRQAAEGKLKNATLEDILKRDDIADDVRATVQALAQQADVSNKMEEGLTVLAEAGMFDLDMLDLIKTGPKEIKAALSLAQKLAGVSAKQAKPQPADDGEEPGEEGEDEEAGASGLTQNQLKRMLSGTGFADDVGKGSPGKPNGKPEKKSYLDKYMPSRKSVDQQQLDKLKAAADARSQVGPKR